jgi:hypothetical protein
MQSPKRRKPNPFDKEQLSEDDEEPLFRIPNCPICMEILGIPVVDTQCCHNQLCQTCADSILARSDPARCPICNHSPLSYLPSIVFNRLLGMREVPCENAKLGCQLRVPICDMQHHLAQYCGLSEIACENAEFGCKWRGQRRLGSEHTRSCVFSACAQTLRTLADKEREAMSRLKRIEKRCEALELSTERALTKFNGEVQRQCLKLQQLQQVQIEGVVRNYDLLPINKESIISIARREPRSTSRSAISMVLSIQVLNNQCIISITGRDPKLYYPFWIAGYAVVLNRGVHRLKAMHQFQHRVGSSKEYYELARVDKAALVVGVSESGKKQVEKILLQLVVTAFSN